MLPPLLPLFFLLPSLPPFPVHYLPRLVALPCPLSFLFLLLSVFIFILLLDFSSIPLPLSLTSPCILTFLGHFFPSSPLSHFFQRFPIFSLPFPSFLSPSFLPPLSVLLAGSQAAEALTSRPLVSRSSGFSFRAPASEWRRPLRPGARGTAKMAIASLLLA